MTTPRIDLSPTAMKDIRHPDILVDIGRKVSAGMTWAEVAESLETELGIKSSPAYVETIYARYATRRNEILTGDNQLRDQVKQEILDWKYQLQKINKQTWEILEDAQMKPEQKLKAMAEVRQQLELQNKIVERMENTFTSKAMNSMDITRLVFAQLSQLEKEGMIKILRMPGAVVEAPFVYKEDAVSIAPVVVTPTEGMENYIDGEVEETEELEEED